MMKSSSLWANPLALPQGYNYNKWSPDDKIDYLLSIVALSQLVLSILQQLLVSFGIPTEVSTTYRVILSASIIIVSFPFLLKRNALAVFTTFIIAFLFYGISVIVHPETEVYWKNEGFRFLFPISLPSALCVVLIKDKRLFYQALFHISYLCALICLLYGIRLTNGSFILERYSIGYGYALLIPIIVLLFYPKWFNILISSVLFLFLVRYGSRAPLVALAVFIIYQAIIRKKFLYLALIVAAVVAINYFSSISDSQILSSRSVQLLESREFFSHDSGRGEIQIPVMRAIRERPITGWGAFGDRVVSGGYSHNLVLEIICDYGFFVGGFILIMLLFVIVSLFFKMNKLDRDVLVVFLSATLIPLMVSSSYLTNTDFAVFIGLLIKYHKDLSDQYRVST